MREIAFAFGVLMVAGLSTTAIAEEPESAATGHTFVRDDVELYYELAGSGPAVVLIHGGLGHSGQLAQQIAALSEEYTVIAPDCRGRGRSGDNDRPLTYAQMADDVVALLDQLEIESAHIVGFSDGAIIGLHLAIHQPKRVKSLMAFGANIRPEGFLSPKAAEEFAVATPDSLPKELRHEWEKLTPDPSRWSVVANKVLRMWRTQPNFTAPQLSGIKVRTLIGAGDRDDISLEHTTEIFRAIPDAQLMIIPGSGHGVFKDQPAVVLQAIQEFLRAEVGAEIVDCGEIIAGPHEGTAEAPDTELGHVDVMPALEVPQFKPGCPNIEASLGTRFGVSVIASGAPDFSTIPLVTRVTHPEIRNPESGRKTTVDQWASPMNAEIPRYAGWSFDKPWELVPGRWRIEILDAQGRVIAAQDFNVRLER